MSELLLGDCLEVMRTLPDCSVDAVVTDPPYGLAFMGKRWDYDVPSVEIWAECLRVLKPGGHLLAFAGTRTQHRMAVRIEDAGFEIRDLIAWVYGSGFPKSLDVSKAIDKAAGAEREVVGSRKLTGTARIKGQAAYGATSGRSEDAYQDGSEINDTLPLTAPATPEAQQWEGWGTALKPALEPITVARKPLIGTVAANVLAHGTGGINVDGCRVAASDGYTENAVTQGVNMAQTSYDPRQVRRTFEPSTSGRWPANLIHDGSDEVVRLFPQTTGGSSGPRVATRERSKGWCNPSPGDGVAAIDSYGDTGSAARFFYTAKASRDDRSDGNTHPTVKPTDLMRYLCRLVTPPGGVVLDPFMGSGSTGKAAMLEGFEFIGIEREVQYHAIAERRIRSAAATGHQPSLPL
jgi:site-specific DNA-methyltransferase (adenine-specific)